MNDKNNDPHWWCLGAPVWVWFKGYWSLRVISSAFGFKVQGNLYWFTDHTNYRLDQVDARCIENAVDSPMPVDPPAHLR